MEPRAAINALAEVIANGTGQATVLEANWQRAAKVLGSSRPPILDQVLPSAAGRHPATASCSGNCTRYPRCSAAVSSSNTYSMNYKVSSGSRNRRPRPAGSWSWAWIR